MLYFYTAYTHSMEGILCVLEYYFLTIIFIIILVSSLFVIIFLFGNLFSFFNQFVIYFALFLLNFYILCTMFFFSNWFSYLKKYFDFEDKHLLSFKKKIEKNKNISLSLRKLSKFRRYITRRYGFIPKENIYFFFFSYSTLLPFFFRNYILIVYIYSSFLRYIGLFLPIFFPTYSKKNFLASFGININDNKEPFFSSYISVTAKKNIKKHFASKKFQTNFLRNLLINFLKAAILKEKSSRIFYTKLMWALDFNFFRFFSFHNHTLYWRSLFSIFFTTYVYFIISGNSFFFFSQKIFLTQLAFVFLNLNFFCICKDSENLVSTSEYVAAYYVKKLYNNNITYGI